MKLACVALSLAIVAASPAIAGNSCPVKQIKEKDSKGSAEVYLFPVSENFDWDKARVLQIYQALSSKQRPDFICNMSGALLGSLTFSDVSCQISRNGRVFIPWVGQGHMIRYDGSTYMSDCSVSWPCIEDATGKRIHANQIWYQRPFLCVDGCGRSDESRTRHIVSRNAEMIDVIWMRYAFEGHAMIIRSKQTGFVCTLNKSAGLQSRIQRQP